jgi:hypothetical protein
MRIVTSSGDVRVDIPLLRRSEFMRNIIDKLDAPFERKLGRLGIRWLREDLFEKTTVGSRGPAGTRVAIVI